MRKIIDYIAGYARWLDKRQFLLASLFTAVLVFANYRFDLNDRIADMSFAGSFICWSLLFLIVFAFGYLLNARFGGQSFFGDAAFRKLLVAAALLFAWKMCFPIDFNFTGNVMWNEYWNAVIYWPLKVIFITACLYLIWRSGDKSQPFYGTVRKDFLATPYLIMLACMIPLVSAAATRPEFLEMYPRYDNIPLLLERNTGWEKILFELAYGSDFFTIELFFRGFLVLAFAKWTGKGAILPMAMFYCTIHFGKPMGECISSYFGGLLLGVVTYHTKTIWGGLMVHLGIAWMMEVAGYLNS